MDVQEDQEISAYAYERTLKLAERVKLLKDLKLPDKELQLQVSDTLEEKRSTLLIRSHRWCLSQ